jgi:hypothetical protein
VLIREMDPNRPDIAQQVSEQALNSDSGSDDDELESKTDIENNHAGTAARLQREFDTSRGNPFHSTTGAIQPSIIQHHVVYQSQEGRFKYTVSEDHTANKLRRRKAQSIALKHNRRSNYIMSEGIHRT